MTGGLFNEKVLASKARFVREALKGIASLPLGSESELLEDPRMLAAGESFLRRGLEALLDLGRHILAKGFGVAAAEYKGVPRGLFQHGVLGETEAELLTRMAGYRNRLVHLYDEVDASELYRVLTEHTEDLADLLEVLLSWVEKDGRVDRSL